MNHEKFMDAFYATALLFSLGGHVGPGLAAAASSVVTEEDSKEEGAILLLNYNTIRSLVIHYIIYCMMMKYIYILV